MNTKNNRRRRESVEKIENVFMALMQERELKEITVADICRETGLNRSTFYANFDDVYDLADKLREKLEADFDALFPAEEGKRVDGAVRMFTHIKENRLLYKTYLKLGYDRRHRVLVYDEERAARDLDNKYLPYHIEFFRSGLNAIIVLWLNGGCRETPEEMAEMLKQEYRGR